MSATETKTIEGELDPPVGNATGFAKFFASDIVSGFLVFLIALPLCLAIALAYGYPPIAGIFTAVVGGILTTFISDSELTIKGPAAGLILIAVGCVRDFGGTGVYDVNNPIAVKAYRAALAVGVVAGVIQILFGVFRVGVVGEYFPLTIVHGMLAAIGVIIIAKQVPPTLGVDASGEPIPLLLGIPKVMANYHAEIAIVGVTSLLIMFLWPLVTKQIKSLRAIPAALIVLVVAIPLGRVLDLSTVTTHKVKLEAHEEHAAAPHAEQAEQPEAPPAAAAPEPNALIKVPPFGETFSAITLPDFSALALPKAWWWVAMFALIGTLESMLTAKAMDMIDPYQRKTNLDRDNLAVGIANTICAFIGAAPMTSEIARSKANVDNGAKTRFADMWHGVFLIACVALLPFVLVMIPKAALSAMLIYTGVRLAHPHEFKHMWEVGPEQLFLFVATIIGVLATDLLIGIGIGILLKYMLEMRRGADFPTLFVPHVSQVDSADGAVVLKATDALTFSNWISLKKRLDRLRQANNNVSVDLSATKLVDHTVMSKLYEQKRFFGQQNLNFDWTGLDNHKAVSDHPQAARIRK
ncbi:MAG: SulP family inorganic anion transporter [Planctomycetales bacterium]|nr:SulP family inorganic anion transporter [Planctomycetales bacterium]